VSQDLTRVFSIGFNLALSCTLQVLLGFILCWIYNNNFNESFSSIFYNIIEFEFASIVRSFHISMTSFIYILLYIHMFKVCYLAIVFDTSLLIWTVGLLLFINLIIIAFIGYVLPLSQMSYWGLTVFSNIIATLPYLGNFLIYWLWGCEFINEYTLIKIHTLHIVIPMEMMFLIILHLVCLHYFISSDSSDRFIFYIERIFFFYWFYFRDMLIWITIFMCVNYFGFIYWYFVFHEESWTVVNIQKTPEKVIPEWLLG